MKLITAVALFPIMLAESCDSSCNPFRKKCKDAIDNGFFGYIFDIPYTITPAKDTFRVGDTIWMESTFSNHMS